MTETIYIVILPRLDKTGIRLIESVWSTKALAESARHYHAVKSGRDFTDYEIIERDIDKGSL